MQTPLRQLLAQYREHSQTEREKGTYFERLAIVFMQRDPGMVQEYEDCWDFATWARLHGLPAGDNGIDAVAKIRGEGGWCDYDLAILSRDALREFLASGNVTITRQDQDRYGRTLARVTVNGRDAGAYLIGQGFAKRWGS